MNGIHDLGGMHGFGPVDVERDEPVFHARWEQRVLGMVYQVVGFGWVNLDAFRHGIERTGPVDYLTLGYYGRWLASLERILVERGVLAARRGRRAEQRPAGLPVAWRRQPPSRSPVRVRARPRSPCAAFAVGDAVRARVASPGGHTRLPRYVAGRRGVIAVHRALRLPRQQRARPRRESPASLQRPL